MSVVLFAGSFGISFALKNFRTTGYFPGSIRNFLSNFAVIIGIVVMTAIDYMAGINTPKLEVPDTIKPTWEGRDWLVSHALIFADHILANPWYPLTISIFDNFHRVIGMKLNVKLQVG